jgi:hypothetical protein
MTDTPADLAALGQFPIALHAIGEIPVALFCAKGQLPIVW